VFPSATAVAVEPGEAAAELTEENARRNGVMGRLEIARLTAAEWAEEAAEADFDLIVSNPPYIPSSELPGLQPEVRDFEDAAALDGGEDGLDVVRQVLRCARRAGAPGARVYLEVHHTHPAVFERAAGSSGLPAEGGRGQPEAPRRRRLSLSDLPRRLRAAPLCGAAGGAERRRGAGGARTRGSERRAAPRGGRKA
ncbi:unnamed protein product, partial [Prorocentrum cordatum]